MAGIYRILNKINNKNYIGLTTKTIELRFKQHIKLINNNVKNKNRRLIHKAIYKYGIDNFDFIKIIEDDSLTLEELKELEKRYISEYNTLYPFGYNLTKGGDGTVGYHLSKSHKEYLSNLYKGKKLSDEHKQNISKGLLKRHYKTSRETIEKIKSNISTKTPIIIFFLDNGEIYRELRSQGDIITIFSNCDKKKVNKVLKRGTQTLGYIGDRVLSCIYKKDISKFEEIRTDINSKYNPKYDTKKVQLIPVVV